MADSKASALSAAATLTGTEIVAGVQSGGDVKITTQAIANLGGGSGLDGLRLGYGGSMFALGSSTFTFVGGFTTAGTSGTASANFRTATTPHYVNYATAATANSIAGQATQLPSVAYPPVGSNFLAWSLTQTVSFPDANYGTGATGARIAVGLLNGSSVTTQVTADAGDTLYNAVWLSYSTTRSNSNWWAVSRSGSGSNVTETDTGIPFSVGDWCLTMWVLPGSSAINYRMEKTDESAGGSGTITANMPANSSTQTRWGAMVATLTTVARNVRFSTLTLNYIMPETP